MIYVQYPESTWWKERERGERRRERKKRGEERKREGSKEVRQKRRRE